MWNSSIFRYLSGALLAASISACSLILGLSDQQCNADSDCVELQLGDTCVEHVCSKPSNCQGSACYGNDAGVGSCSSDKDCAGTSTPSCLKSHCVSAELAAQWSCEAPMSAMTETVKYSFRVVDFLSKKPPEAVVVKACRNADPICERPVATFTDSGTTGDVHLDLPLGFQGFFEINSTQMPALLYVNKPIVQDTQDRDVPVLTTDTVKLLSTLAGFPFTPDKGVALLEAIDCSGAPAGDVAFTATLNGDLFYIVDGVPSGDATVTKYDPVDNTADGGFLNLDPGFVTFGAYLSGPDGIELGTFRTQVRANTITFVAMTF